MKSLRIQERQVTVASYQQRWLYVYSGIKRQHIFSFQDDVVDFCLDEGEDASWLLWAISQSGRVYRIAEKDITHQRVSEAYSSNSQVNNAIFEEFFQDLPDTSFISNTEPSSHISPKDAIFEVGPKGAAICAHTDILAIATSTKKSAILHIYTKKDLTSNDGPKEPCFSTDLCLPNPDFSDISLYIVASSVNACFSGSSNLCLEPLVFSSIFGTQTSILDSAVILMTLSDGHVYYLPLKRWLPLSSSSKGYLPILCDLNSPIVQIFVLEVKILGAEDPTDQLSLSQLLTSFRESVSTFSGLLVCALSGQCCLFSAPTNFKTNFQVMQKTVLKDAPTKACCVGDGASQFFYATRKNIVTVEISYGDRLEVSEKVYKKLAGIKNMASVVIKDETFLLCQSENGRFYSLPKSNDGFDTNEQIVCPKNTIPDLLAKVDNITRKMDQINPNIKCQSHILSQLALASHLYLNTPGSVSVNRHLQSSVTVKHINGSTTLCFQVTSSKMVLSSDWSLLVETRQISPANEEMMHQANFKSVHLKKGLQPGESVKIDIVPNLRIPSDTRVSVRAWLVLNLHLGFYSSTFHREQFKALEDQGLMIFVFESQTDFLDFLICKDSLKSEVGLCPENKRFPPVSLVINAIAQKRPVYSAFEDIPTFATENLQEKHVYKILIPDYLSVFLFDHTCQDVTHRSCLLKYLLCQMKISGGQEISGTFVILDTTDWGQVTIGIQKSSNDTKQYFMEIHTGNAGSLVEMVLGVMKRIKRLLPTGLAKTLDISKFITEIQKAKENLRSIEENIKSNKDHNIGKVMNSLLYLFLDIYNIDYQLICQLHD